MNASKTASSRLGRSRTKPIFQIIDEQRTRLELLDSRIGRLMTERADEEEILAEMYRQLSTSQRAELGLPEVAS